MFHHVLPGSLEMPILLLTALLVFAASWIGSGLMTSWLRRRLILDHPVERSSHVLPVPKGCGIAITAVETGAIGFGLAFVAALTGIASGGYLQLVVALSAAVLGFLPWNWHPARVFLGDVGSVPLGFVAGWLLLLLASRGYWASAL